MSESPKCVLCGREGTVTAKIISHGQTLYVSLCPVHALAMQELSNELRKSDEKEERAYSLEKLLHCPRCGISLETVKERQRFGCPACYETFASFLPAWVSIRNTSVKCRNPLLRGRSSSHGSTTAKPHE
ncbi:hypothetical protein VDG1235_4494 [Verrucomicrobiia bacterium DG1235]|nr:hypothetical protein VDG1235_4494 [Verrucomicrobiae bacterium DG1235]